jgi:hypothetical protein
MDFRKAGFLDRATEAFGQVLQADPRTCTRWSEC